MPNKKNILLLAPYLSFPDEPGANRFITVATMLAEHYNVTLVTSRFCHLLKKQRTKTYPLDKVNTILIDEPGYKKNVSLGRLTSHRVFSQNFEKYLKAHGNEFDLVYSAYPLIYTNYLLGKYKDAYGYKLIIDVQDIWPDSIMGPVSLFANPVGHLLLKPINQYADKTYSFADGLVAVSQTYLDKADVTALPDDKKTVVFIGADWVTDHIDPDKYTTHEPLVATYIGTMGGSYDLDTVVEAAKLCDDNVVIQMIGTGPDEERLRALNEKNGNRVQFLGAMPYDQAMSLLKQSDVAINAIKSLAQASITNKLSDYFCSGLPILSCQENQEVKDLLAKGGGRHYQASQPSSLAKELNYLAQHRNELAKMSEINIELAKQHFWRPVSYQRILNLVASTLAS